MKHLSLGHNKFAIVDDDVFETLNDYSWHLDGRGYVITAIQIARSYNKIICPKGKHKVVKLHRLIMNTPVGYEVDHINHDRLDNRRANLRNCTKGQNMRNLSRVNPKSSSVFFGVSWRADRELWRAYISRVGDYIHLGHFKSELHAAMAHDIWEAELGTWAQLNFK